MSQPRARPSPAVSRKEFKNSLFHNSSGVSDQSHDGSKTLWNKFGSLGRRKKNHDSTRNIELEGTYVIDSPGMPISAEVPPEDYILNENEERSMIEPRSFADPKFKSLIEILLGWINDVLHTERIIVKDIEEDLYDGQIIQKLLENLSGERLSTPELALSDHGQRAKLRTVLNFANKILTNEGRSIGTTEATVINWSAESIHTKNVVSTLHLLVALVRHYRAPIRLPSNVTVNVVVVQKRNGILNHRVVVESITNEYDDLALKNDDYDAFDKVFSQNPEKLQMIKNSMLMYVNKHLSQIDYSVNDFETEFCDGVCLCLLMGILEDFFVPLSEFSLDPQSFSERLANVTLSFQLMYDAGLPQPKSRPEDIVNGDVKSTLRVLYNIYEGFRPK